MTTELPIVAIRGAFVDAMARPSPVVVVAPTGSGKSTQLPVWMEERCDGVVMVVEPRRIACRALAEFVASQYSEAVGGRVGYRVRFDSAICENTRIEFVTPGVALRLLRGPSKERYQAVLIDEFHERHWEVDLLVMLLRAEVEQGLSRKLVLTSATVAGEELAEEIGGTLLEATGRTFPVSLSYLTDVSGPTRRDLEERVVQGVKYALGSETPDDTGDILVFLPGKGEIDGCRRLLSQALSAESFDLVPVHADLPTQRLVQALGEHGGRRRIFLATNVAETSLTLPRVTVVIDAGLARMRIHRGGRSALALVPIPADLMMQRAGRAGRVAPGRCIRLWQQSYRPEPFLQPEIERVELDDLLIQAACYGWDGPQIGEAPWVTPPPSFALEEAQLRLQQMGALNATYRVTELGRALTDWPVSAQEASLLVGAPPELQSVLADTIALLQQRRSLMLPAPLLPSKQQEEIVEERRLLLAGCGNEVYVELMCLRQGDVRKHGLHANSLRHTRSIARQLRTLMGLKVVDVTKERSPLPSSDEFAGWFLHRVPAMGFVLRPRALKEGKKTRRGGRSKRREHPWANGLLEVMVEPFEPVDADSSQRPPTAGVILAHTWIGERGLKIRGKGRLLLPCSPKTLASAGLGDASLEEPKLLKKDGSLEVIAVVTQKLAGVTLRAETTSLRGASLCEAAASFLLQNRWLKGAGELVLDDLHLLRLLHEWPSHEKSWSLPPETHRGWDDPVLFVSQTLLDLGVEESSDLSLLSTEDVRPNIEALVGVDRYTLEELRRDFPRLWSLHGATYKCIVKPRQYKVEMQPENAQARKGKEPSASLLPRFRGFQVDYRRASRLVSLRKK